MCFEGDVEKTNKGWKLCRANCEGIKYSVLSKSSLCSSLVWIFFWRKKCLLAPGILWGRPTSRKTSEIKENEWKRCQPYHQASLRRNWLHPQGTHYPQGYKTRKYTLHSWGSKDQRLWLGSISRHGNEKNSFRKPALLPTWNRKRRGIWW